MYSLLPSGVGVSMTQEPFHGNPPHSDLDRSTALKLGLDKQVKKSRPPILLGAVSLSNGLSICSGSTLSKPRGEARGSRRVDLIHHLDKVL